MWRAGRSNYWIATAIDLVVVSALLWGLVAWQTRHALDVSALAPRLSGMAALDGATYESPDGVTTVVYFFAPWCHVCEYSIDNLADLRRARPTEEVEIVAVALSYADQAEIKTFLDRHDVNFPVLLGQEDTARAWRVTAFPTYYVIGPDRDIRHRSIGYSTELGLRFRT